MVFRAKFDWPFLDVLRKAAWDTGRHVRSAGTVSFHVVCVAAPLDPCAGRGRYNAPTERPRNLSSSPGSAVTASPPHVIHGTLFGTVLFSKDETYLSAWSLAALNRYLVPC